MLIGYDFCIANGIILDFKRRTLILKHDDDNDDVDDDELTEVENVQTIESERKGGLL